MPLSKASKALLGQSSALSSNFEHRMRFYLQRDRRKKEDVKRDVLRTQLQELQDSPQINKVSGRPPHLFMHLD